MAFIGGNFTSVYRTKQLNPWPCKLISQSCDKLQPAVCLPRRYAAIWRWPEHSWTSDRPQKQATAKAVQATFSINTYLPELLVNVYSYNLLVKSVSYCCVRGSRLFSNPVKYTCVALYFIHMCCTLHACTCMVWCCMCFCFYCMCVTCMWHVCHTWLLFKFRVICNIYKGKIWLSVRLHSCNCWHADNSVVSALI